MTHAHRDPRTPRPVVSRLGTLVVTACIVGPVLGALGCSGATEAPPSTAPKAETSAPPREPESDARPDPASATAPEEEPARLESRVGATVEGELAPRDTVRHPIHLEAGEYVEVHLDRGRYEVRLLAHPPLENGELKDAVGWGEHSAEPPGQSLWVLAERTGDHMITIRNDREAESGPYRATVLRLHPAGPPERARKEGQEAWETGYALKRKHRCPEALPHLEEAFELWTRAAYLRGIAAAQGRWADCLLETGRIEEGIVHLQRAIELWEKAGDPRGVAGNLTVLAGAKDDLNQYTEAEAAARRALAISAHGVAPETYGYALGNLCAIHESKGEIPQAIEACETAVTYWESLGQPENATSPLNNLGIIHRRRGNLDRAQEYYDRVLRILDEHPDAMLEATIHHNLGTLYDSRGEFQKALEEYQKVLTMVEDRGNPAKVANQYYNIGTVYQRMGELDTTLAYYRRARTIQEELDVAGNDLLLTLLGIGWAHVLQGHPELAREPMERGLALSRDAGAKFYIALGLRRMAHLEIEDGRPERAIPLIAEGLALARDLGNRWEESILLSHLATAQLDLGQTEAALEDLRQAVKVNEEIGYRRELARNHYEMSRIHRLRGDLVRASREIEEALAVADQVRQQVGAREIRTLVGATHQEYFDFHIDLLMERHARDPTAGHAAEALRAAERARSRSLLEVLGEAELGLDRRMPPALVADREELRRELAAAEARRARLLEEDGAADPVELFRVKVDLDNVLTRLAEVERKIRAADPSYAALTRPDPVTVGEIQRTVVDEETSLLELRLGRERSFLFVVTQDRFETFELPPREALEEDSRCLHWLVTAFENPNGADAGMVRRCLDRRVERFERPPGRTPFDVRAHRRRQIEQAFSERAARLSEALLGEAARAGLLTTPRLAFVADGALEYVPLAALSRPDAGRLLVRDHEVVHLPSASVLAFQRRQPVRERELRGTVAILADPIYGLDDERSEPSEAGGDSVRAPSGRRHYPRLLYSAREARAIAALTPEGDASVLLGSDVTREAAAGDALAGYRYVHFATHGVIDARYPALSGLVLSQVDGTGRPIADDGFLRLHDIYDMRLDAELIVLSACETALGREIRGEGLVGLARGFMYAGADRVVASLWRVQDTTTALLMERFYRGLLREGRRPADALRRAQLAMLSRSEGRLSFPYYWAGFELQGDWQ